MKLKYGVKDGMCQDRCLEHEKEIFIGGLYCKMECKFRGKKKYTDNFIECKAENIWRISK